MKDVKPQIWFHGKDRVFLKVHPQTTDLDWYTVHDQAYRQVMDQLQAPLRWVRDQLKEEYQ